jgi:hypothetical membrane protein
MTEYGSRRLGQRLALYAGIAGPIIFVATFTIEGCLRPGYDALGMYVSELSLGPRGWIQVLNFIVLGALLLVFARAVAIELPDGKASRAGPILLGVFAIGILASGPFVMDPVGTPVASMSLHGLVHQLIGAVVFTLMPTTCIVFVRRFRPDRAMHAMLAWTVTAAIVSAAAIVLQKVAQLGRLPPRPPNALTPLAGLLQRTSLVTFLAWLCTVALALYRKAPRNVSP